MIRRRSFVAGLLASVFAPAMPRRRVTGSFDLYDGGRLIDENFAYSYVVDVPNIVGSVTRYAVTGSPSKVWADKKLIFSEEGNL